MTQRPVKSSQVENLARSAMAPLMSATVMIAKVGLEPDEEDLGDPHVGAEHVDDRRAVGVDRGSGRVTDDTLESEVLERVADDAADVAATEGHRVAPQHVDDADDAHGAERHHHHVEDGLGARHAAVEEGEAGRHQQHQGGAEEDEGRRRCVDRGLGRGGEESWAHGEGVCERAVSPRLALCYSHVAPRRVT